MSNPENPLYRKTLEDLRGQTLDEIEAVRLRIEEGLAGCAENAELAESQQGQRLIKRLAADLAAIRRKYAGIKGNPDDQLAALHRLQGREQQVAEELDNLTKAAQAKINLGLQMEAAILAIGDKRRESVAR
jgi:hypothetical protein